MRTQASNHDAAPWRTTWLLFLFCFFCAAVLMPPPSNRGLRPPCQPRSLSAHWGLPNAGNGASEKKKTVTLHLGQKNTISCRTIGDRPESRSKIASAVAAGLAMAIHKRYAKAPAGASGTPKRPVTGSQTIGKRRKNRETSERATQRAAVDDSRATRPNRSASQ